MLTRMGRQWMRNPALVCGTLMALAALAQADGTDAIQGVRKRILHVQDSMLSDLRNANNPRVPAAKRQEGLRKVQTLLKLHEEERRLGALRLKELERTLKELEARKDLLTEKAHNGQIEVRGLLRRTDAAAFVSQGPEQKGELDRGFALAKGRLLGAMADRSFKQLEALKVDLEDSNELSRRISEERQQIEFVLQDLDEQKAVLELNRQLQADLVNRHVTERVAKLDHYQKLKSAEQQVESLIKDFNSRLELEKVQEAERTVAARFAKRRSPAPKLAFVAPQGGALAQGIRVLPIKSGKILTGFGKVMDAKSGLQIYHKGLELSPAEGLTGSEPVLAVATGKIAYAGVLPEYGRVAIVDHGNHYYSLSGRLREIVKKVGDEVNVGDVIGSTEPEKPLYFEIRSRNVAVNPLQWFGN